MHITEMKNIEQLANEELEKISGGLHGHGIPGGPRKKIKVPKDKTRNESRDGGATGGW